MADFKDYTRQVHIINRQNLHHSATKILLLTVLAVCLTFQRLQTHCNTLTNTCTHTQCCSINSRRRCTICTIPRFYLRTFMLVYVYTCVCIYTYTSICVRQTTCVYIHTQVYVSDRRPPPTPPPNHPPPRTSRADIYLYVYFYIHVFMHVCL